MLVRYKYFSGADNGYCDELNCLGFPRDEFAPALKQHGDYVCDEDDFRKFFRAVVRDAVLRPFQKPRVQVILVERGDASYLWKRFEHNDYYAHGRIRTAKERTPTGCWMRVS